MQGGRLRFLDGGGKTGAMIRARDWAATPLGAPEDWPAELRTLVGVMLAAAQPMFIAWGREARTMIYNDLYAELMGSKHPAGLGECFDVVWAEAMDELEPLIQRIYRGEPIHDADLTLYIDRGHGLREAHFAFSYTPVRDAGGHIVGLFCPCRETTEEVFAQRAREAERERTVRLFTHAPGFIAIVEGPEHRYSYVNEAYRAIIGDREYIGRSVRQAVPEIADQGYLELLDEVYASGRAQRLTEQPLRLEGTPTTAARDVIIDFVFQPVMSDAGAVTGIFIEGHETTERSRAEQVLRESESRFRTAVAAAHGVLWTNTPHGEMVGEQPGWAELTGQSQREYEGYGWADAIHPDDARGTIDAWRAAVDERRQFDFEHRVRRHDGVWRIFSVRAIPSIGPDGAIREWIGLHTDITDQRDAAQALRDSEAQFRGVTEALPGFVWTADAHGYLTYTSPRWHQYSGSDPDESNDTGWMQFLHPEDQPRALETWSRSVASGAPFEVELRLRNRDGDYHWWLARAGRHEGGGPEWIGTATELDAIVEARQTLSRSREELELLIDARTAALREAEDQLRQSQKLEAIGQLTGGVAHDFNNLLTVIRGSVDLLRRPGITEERQHRYIEAISDTVTRAAKLTGQLLAFARRQALQPDVFDVVADVAAINEMVRTLSGARVKVEMQLPAAPLHVDADPSQFDTAIVNMVANARDAMDGEGTLKIGVTASDGIPADGGRPVPGDFVAISVTDTGTGIAPDAQARIFEPFFTTKGVGLGTGLGLSQVYGFAIQSGGDVRLKSAIGEGATFTLYLPRVAAPEGIEALPVEPVTVAEGDGICVLVVEDNPEVGMFAKQTLAELGFDTVFADNGAAALAELNASTAQIDVVFSDVMMPGMSGLELGEEIRRRHPELPVVLTTGYSHILAQRGSGGFELLQKPYSMEQLAHTLQKAARRRHRSEHP